MSVIPKLPSIPGATRDPTEYFIKKKKDPIAYLQRPPLIKPNYGKPRRSFLLKTNISRVLLYDNTTQDQMLDVRLSYIQNQQRRMRRLIKIGQQNFHTVQEKRRKQHERLLQHYQTSKDAYIAQFGTRYMPVPKVEAEVDPFLVNVRLVPVLNVLCYFLYQKEVAEKKKNKRKNKQGNTNTAMEHVNPIPDSQKDANTQPNAQQSSINVIGKDAKSDAHTKHVEVPVLYTHSIEDPRFRNLEEILESPVTENDGYIQLSPTYIKDTQPRRRFRPAKGRVITLPNFYRKNRPPSPVSDDSGASDVEQTEPRNGDNE